MSTNRAFPVLVAIAGTLLALSALAGWWLRQGAGLERQLLEGAAVDRGLWLAPTSDLYEIWIDSDAVARVLLDGLVAADGGASGGDRRIVWVDRGAHAIEIQYASRDASARAFRLARTNRRPTAPSDGVFLASGNAIGSRLTLLSLLPVLWIVGLCALAAAASLALHALTTRLAPALARSLRPGWTMTVGTVGKAVLVLLVVGYGGLLRFDALTETRGPVERPGWLRSAQQARLDDPLLRPADMHWPREEGRYISDPYTYLQYARSMESFYAAHRREPVFPFSTKLALALLDDQDVAVSFASAAFSILVIGATFLVGATAFSYWVGLGAAAAIAIEYIVVTIGVQGWRDDAFTCAVLLVTWGLLRVARDPTWRAGALLGVLAGLACLTRITALSFMVPALVWLLLDASPRERRSRLRALAPAILTMTVIVVPFLVNCWRVYGDPFYAINVHADVYREAEGQSTEEHQTTRQYLASRWRDNPADLADTVLLGLTRYPFANKWSGFDVWSPRLGPALAVASLLGLGAWLLTSAGRLVLVVLVTSLLPYAATWRLIGDWRFTMHAYPFLLMASMVAIVWIGTLVWPGRANGLGRIRQPTVAFRAVGVLVLVAGLAWIATRTLPVLVVRQAIEKGIDVNVTAGDRDWAFVGDGWTRPWTSGAVTTRATTGTRATIHLPVPAPRDLDLVIRLDPFPKPLDGTPFQLPVVRAFLNDRPLATFQTNWQAERVGAYDLHVPAALVTRGWNTLTLATEGSGLRWWYVRVRQVSAPTLAHAR